MDRHHTVHGNRPPWPLWTGVVSDIETPTTDNGPANGDVGQ
jgi:hypothetical protein